MSCIFSKIVETNVKNLDTTKPTQENVVRLLETFVQKVNFVILI